MYGTDAIGPLWDRTDACSDGDNNGPHHFFSVDGCGLLWKPLSANHGGVHSVHDLSISSPLVSHHLQAPPNLGSWHPRSSNVLWNLPLIPNTWKTGWPPPSPPSWQLRGAGLQSSPNSLPNSPSQCQRHGGGLVVAWVQRLCLEHFAETLEADKFKSLEQQWKEFWQRRYEPWKHRQLLLMWTSQSSTA